MKVMAFEIAFSMPGKVMDFRKSGRGHDGISFYGPTIYEKLSLLSRKNKAPKMLGFRHFVITENLNWSWKSH